jgi:hypothetical protein
LDDGEELHHVMQAFRCWPNLKYCGIDEEAKVYEASGRHCDRLVEVNGETQTLDKLDDLLGW